MELLGKEDDDDNYKMPKSHTRHHEVADFETALNQTGHGIFNTMVLSTCSLGLLAVGFQNGIMAYLLPSARCDLNMTTTQMGEVNASYLIGGITSACLWGILADIFGRRKILLITFICDAIITIFGSLAYNFYALGIMRFFNGFFIGGPGCLVFTYLSDLIPLKNRTKYICFVGFCFVMSWILLPAIALFVIPLKFEVDITKMTPRNYKFNSWRLYYLLFSLPSVITTIFLLKLPESPRLLLENGQKDKALKILKYIFVKNTARSSKEYTIKTLIQERKFINARERQDSTIIVSGKALRLLKGVMTQTKTLFKPPYLGRTIAVIIIMFANMFGCYGLGLWIPEILSRFRKDHGNDSTIRITLCKSKDILPTSIKWNDFNQTKYQEESTMDLYKDLDYEQYSDIKNSDCGDMIDSQIFKDTMAIGVACLVYNFLSSCIADFVNPKILPGASMAIAGLSAALLVWLDTPQHFLTAASVFQAAMMTGNIVIVGLIMASFPPRISSMSVCIATFAGRLGSICSNIIFGSFLDVSCEIPLILVAALSFVGAVLVIFVKSEFHYNDSKEKKPDPSTTEGETIMYI